MWKVVYIINIIKSHSMKMSTLFEVNGKITLANNGLELKPHLGGKKERCHYSNFSQVDRYKEQQPAGSYLYEGGFSFWDIKGVELD